MSAPTLVAGLGLYPAEHEKLDRLSDRIAAVLATTGIEGAWICEANGRGDARTVYFHKMGHPERTIIAMKSLAFLASDSSELLQMIERHLSKVHGMAEK